MKKTFLKMTVLIAIVLFLSQCRKEDHTIYKSYFYTSVNPVVGRLSLYIDDQYMGELPYLAVEPTCGSDSIMDKTIFTNLVSGNYSVKAYDKSGNLKSSNKIRFSNGSSGASGTKGGCKMIGPGECIIVDVFY